MPVREEIEEKRPQLRSLLEDLKLRRLFVYFDGPESWGSLTFVGDFNLDDLNGYADRFFECETGLLRLFHRRVRLIELEVFERNVKSPPTQALELRHAS